MLWGFSALFTALWLLSLWYFKHSGGFPLPMERWRAKSLKKFMVGINRQVYLSHQPLMAMDISWNSSQESEFLSANWLHQFCWHLSFKDQKFTLFIIYFLQNNLLSDFLASYGVIFSLQLRKLKSFCFSFKYTTDSHLITWLQELVL